MVGAQHSQSWRKAGSTPLHDNVDITSGQQLVEAGEAFRTALVMVQGAQQICRTQAGHCAICWRDDNDVRGGHVNGILHLPSVQHHLEPATHISAYLALQK